MILGRSATASLHYQPVAFPPVCHNHRCSVSLFNEELSRALCLSFRLCPPLQCPRCCELASLCTLCSSLSLTSASLCSCLSLAVNGAARPGSVTEPLTGDMQTDRQQTDERRERAAGNSWKHLLLHDRKERCIGVGSTDRAQGGRENLLRMDVKVPRRTATRFSRGRASVCVYTHRCVCVCVCVCVSVYVCVFTFVCIYVHVHQYIRTHLSIYAHRTATRFSRRGVSVCLWRRDGEYVASKHSDTRARASACAFTEGGSLECFRNLRLMLLCVLHVQLIRLRKFDAPVEEGEK